jgi:hypothetical protein
MQLIYRGSSYTLQPATATPTKATMTTTHTLMYRGLEFTYQKPTGMTNSAPKAVNWRFAQVCQPRETFVPAHS